MKKALLVLVTVVLIAVPVFAQFKVGFVTDTGGIDDKSSNQSTWEGIIRFAQDNNLPKANYKYLQSSSEADYIPNLSAFADDSMNLVIANGFLFENSLPLVARGYPANNFLIIGTEISLPNVVSAIFTENEGSFLVGVAAGLKAKEDGKDTVGFLGGMEVPPIQKYEAGYVQGVKTVYPDCKVLIDYVGDFAAPGKGQAIAQKQYTQGAYIIYHMAGDTGNGLIKEARERCQKGDIRWVIGAERDQYADGSYIVYENGQYVTKSVILTSMVKHFDVAAYDVCKMTMDSMFPGGQTLVFSLKNNGIGLPENNPNLSSDIITKVNDYKALIASGQLKINTSPQNESNFVLKYFVDAFGDSTTEPYLYGQTKGLFSNYATTGSDLKVGLLLSKDEMGISLFEYGYMKVKSDAKYTINIKLPNGNIYQIYSAGLYPEMGRIILTYLPWGIDPALMFDGKSIIKFLITDEKAPQVRYTFSIVFPTTDYLEKYLGNDIPWLHTFR